MTDDRFTEFEQVAQRGSVDNVFTDFWFFLRHSKKWWLVPIVLLLIAFGALMLLSGTAAAPFIYTIF